MLLFIAGHKNVKVFGNKKTKGYKQDNQNRLRLRMHEGGEPLFLIINMIRSQTVFFVMIMFSPIKFLRPQCAPDSTMRI
jgi:hypothetical protein